MVVIGKKYSHWFQYGGTSHYWADGSPYAFQKWEKHKQSLSSTLDMEILILYKEKESGRWLRRAQRKGSQSCSDCIQYIEPRADPVLACTAVVITVEGTLHWTKIPCTEEYPGVALICEVRAAYLSQAKVTPQIERRHRRYIECPPRAWSLTLKICIRIYTSVWKSFDDVGRICNIQSGALFRIPGFIASKDPFLYDADEAFLVSFLQAMNHR